MRKVNSASCYYQCTPGPSPALAITGGAASISLCLLLDIVWHGPTQVQLQWSWRTAFPREALQQAHESSCCLGPCCTCPSLYDSGIQLRCCLSSWVMSQPSFPGWTGQLDSSSVKGLLHFVVVCLLCNMESSFSFFPTDLAMMGMEPRVSTS